MASNFRDARVATGPLNGRKVAEYFGDVFAAEARSIDIVAHLAARALIRHPLESIQATIEGYHKVYRAKLDKDPFYYKARSLDGIWASAPYLHNGSVANLYELLRPAASRQKKFYVGSREFDPERVGFDGSAGASRSLFDSSLPGNTNVGHEYGTALNEGQRIGLIEFLKSL